MFKAAKSASKVTIRQKRADGMNPIEIARISAAIGRPGSARCGLLPAPCTTDDMKGAERDMR